jgi:hypothetical protein
MTMPSGSTNNPAQHSSELLEDAAVVLGDMTSALARGEVGDGTRLMEHALMLNVRWEQLTTAVHKGIERGYEHGEAPATR